MNDPQIITGSTSVPVPLTMELYSTLLKETIALRAEVEGLKECSKIDKQANDEYREIRAANLAVIHDLTAQLAAVQKVRDEYYEHLGEAIESEQRLREQLAAMTGERDDFKEALVSMTTARILTEDAAQLLKEQLTAMTQERDALRRHHQKTQEALGICGGVFGSPAYHITILKQQLAASEARLNILDEELKMKCQSAEPVEVTRQRQLLPQGAVRGVNVEPTPQAQAQPAREHEGGTDTPSSVG